MGWEDGAHDIIVEETEIARGELPMPIRSQAVAKRLLVSVSRPAIVRWCPHDGLTTADAACWTPYEINSEYILHGLTSRARRI